MKKIVFLIFITFVQVTNAQKEIYQDTIPFRDDLGIIIIPITFNGEIKQFAFDTGAQQTLAYSWAKESLQKTGRSTTITSSSGLKSNMLFYDSGTVSLGSRKITGHQILNTPENEIFSCYKIDGILGVDIIKLFNWSIDYQNKILIMYPSNYFPKKVTNMNPLDFTFQKGRPYIYLKVKKNRFKFLLDTGAGGSSNISKRNYSLSNIDEIPQTSFYSGSFDVNGIFTTTKPVIFQLPKASSKKVTLSPIIFYDNLKSSKIGNSLWEGQELFLSLKRKQLYIASSHINEIHESYSCSVIYHKRKIRIMRIQMGSDLWNEGVRQGDEVVRFDGKEFSDFCSLDQYQRKLARSGKPFTLQLANGKIFKVAKKATLK